MQDSQLGPNGVLYREAPLYICNTYICMYILQQGKQQSTVGSHTDILFPHTCRCRDKLVASIQLIL